jgi:hypothetical protein
MQLYSLTHLLQTAAADVADTRECLKESISAQRTAEAAAAIAVVRASKAEAAAAAAVLERDTAAAADHDAAVAAAAANAATQASLRAETTELRDTCVRLQNLLISGEQCAFFFFGLMFCFRI